MEFRDRLQKDLQAAMKAGDVIKRETLRTLLAALTHAEVEKQGEFTDADLATVLQREVKKRREAIEAYQAGGRKDLVDKETQELHILQTYMPKQLSPQEIEAVVSQIIAGLSAAGKPNLGQVMGAAMGKLKGQADGNAVRQVVAKLLQ